MNMPIQATPIDRANRHIMARSADAGANVRTSDWKDVICKLCPALPPPLNAICPIICSL